MKERFVQRATGVLSQNNARAVRVQLTYRCKNPDVHRMSFVMCTMELS